MPKIEISRNYFPKGKPVDQVHEFMDRAGLVHRGPAAIATLGSWQARSMVGLPRLGRRWGGVSPAAELRLGRAMVRAR
jgi:hypothetical protein